MPRLFALAAALSLLLASTSAFAHAELKPNGHAAGRATIAIGSSVAVTYDLAVVGK